MEADEQSRNPYAISVSAVISADSAALHRNFELVGRKLYCRSGLQLPEYCLVTGTAEDLVPLSLSLWAPGKSLRRYRFVGIGLMMLVPIVVVLAIMFGGAAPADHFAVVVVTSICGLLIVGLVLFLIGGRRGQLCMLQGMVDRRRQNRGRRLAVIPAWIMLAVLAVSVTMGGNRGYVFSLLMMFAVGSQVISGWFFLRGTQLRAVVDEQGVFEVSGFSKQFLERLREQSDGR